MGDIIDNYELSDNIIKKLLSKLKKIDKRIIIKRINDYRIVEYYIKLLPYIKDKPKLYKIFKNKIIEVLRNKLILPF